MSFTWTYPDPLNPNQPSLIGNHLRNVIPTLAIYIQELCDAIDTLRENIGQTPYNWTIYRPSVGDTLLYEHYRQLQLRLDELIGSLGYTSVIDILGRTWSDYQETINSKDYAKWQIIQDFRDVCDVLSTPLIEKWRSVLTPINYNEIYFPANQFQKNSISEDYNFAGDIGFWHTSESAFNAWVNTKGFTSIWNGVENGPFHSDCEVVDEQLKLHADGGQDSGILTRAQVLTRININLKENDKFVFKIAKQAYSYSPIVGEFNYSNYPHFDIHIELKGKSGAPYNYRWFEWIFTNDTSRWGIFTEIINTTVLRTQIIGALPQSGDYESYSFDLTSYITNYPSLGFIRLWNWSGRGVLTTLIDDIGINRINN